MEPTEKQVSHFDADGLDELWRTFNPSEETFSVFVKNNRGKIVRMIGGYTETYRDGFSRILRQDVAASQPVRLRTADQWASETDCVILDPDGWINEGIPYDEPIDKDTFDRLKSQSTLLWRN